MSTNPPTFSFAAFVDASVLWLLEHPLAFVLLASGLVLAAFRLWVVGIERDMDRIGRDAHIEGAFDRAHEELTQQTRKGAA
jgi:hypothetical protein